MGISQSTDECKYCGGRLLEQETFWRSEAQRFAEYRCEACKKISLVRVDKSIMEIYPQIQHISMEVLKMGSQNPRRYENDSIRDQMRFCSDPKCTNPGIFMDLFLYEMIEGHKTQRSSWEFCHGVELTPKGRIRRTCEQSFNITVSMVYKNNKASGGLT